MEFAPYLHSGSNNSPSELINYIKQKLNYNFYDEDFREIKEIDIYVKRIQKTSENFFLINNKDTKNLKKIRKLI